MLREEKEAVVGRVSFIIGCWMIGLEKNRSETKDIQTKDPMSRANVRDVDDDVRYYKHEDEYPSFRYPINFQLKIRF